MDDEPQLFDLKIETEQGLTERAMVEELQDFVDAYQDITDELDRIDGMRIINEQLALLDTQSPHTGEDVIVHGNVLQAYYDELEGKDAIEAVFHNGAVLQSAGFTVQNVASPNGEGSRAVVGHLFKSPYENRDEEVGTLVQRNIEYFSFAPYGKVDIQGNKTPDEILNRLESLIPDTIQEIDEIVLNSSNSLNALSALNKLSYSRKDFPQDILYDLALYVNAVVDAKSIGPIYCGVNGMFNVDILPGMQISVPFRQSQYDGGTVQIIGNPKSLHLSQYASYVDGEVYQSNDLYWAVDVEVLRVEGADMKLIGKTVDFLVGNLRDPVVIDIPEMAA